MALGWEKLVENYNYYFHELSHPLTKHWLLARSPIPLFTILLAYNIFCTKIGPALMRNREPYNLKTTIKFYNLFQVIISAYSTYEGYVYLFTGNFNFQCQGVEGHERVARAIYVYLITKLIELLDTVFFVLRKSDRQITFLHLYHHTLMPIVSWIGIKYFPGGQGVLFGAINSLVHVVMYTYYYLSGLGPQYQKYLWWKKYLTVMQIVQFLIVLLHSVNSLFYSCSFLPILKVLTIIFAGVFVYMFSKFYYLNYIVNRNRPHYTNIQSKVPKDSSRDGKSHNGKTVENNASFANGFVNPKLSRNKVDNTANGDEKLNGSSDKDNKYFASKDKSKCL